VCIYIYIYKAHITYVSYFLNNRTTLHHLLQYSEDNTSIIQFFCVSQICHTKEGEHYASKIKKFLKLSHQVPTTLTYVGHAREPVRYVGLIWFFVLIGHLNLICVLVGGDQKSNTIKDICWEGNDYIQTSNFIDYSTLNSQHKWEFLWLQVSRRQSTSPRPINGA